MRTGSEDDVQGEVETCRAEVWGMGGAVLCGIRELNILEWLGTHSRLFGFVLGFWMETLGVATRTTADQKAWTLNHLGWRGFLSLIYLYHPLSTRTFYVCDLFGVS